MDEREIINEIKWNFSKGRSRAEITRDLQGMGFKLEFIDSLIKSAKRPRKIFKGIFYFVILFFFVWLSIYGIFFYSVSEIIDYSPNWKINNTSYELNSLKEFDGKIIITPEMISFFAQEIGANKLRTNPLNFKKPIINFEISEQYFNTIIDKKIQTKRGIDKEADLLFITTTEVIQEIFLSENKKEAIISEIKNERIGVVQLSSEQNLFLKGYLTLYKELN
jgi:phosphatidylglycerophosphatase A